MRIASFRCGSRAAPEMAFYRVDPGSAAHDVIVVHHGVEEWKKWVFLIAVVSDLDVLTVNI